MRTGDIAPHPPISLTAVVMAKPAIPGQVKTRLTSRYTAQQAAMVHDAMMQCVLTRVRDHVGADQLVLALAGEPGAGQFDPAYRVIPQGTGDLGERLARIWRAIGSGPTAFFGIDSPDLPVEHLRAIKPALSQHQALVGPVGDGGYWTLSAHQPQPTLLQGIDWGTPNVYHQTRGAADQAHLDLADLPDWHDVDLPEDLDALWTRLAGIHEPALTHLRSRLAPLFGS